MVGEGEPVTLDGSASSDPDTDPLTSEWRDALGALLGDEATLTITLASGIHDITLTVSDGEYTSTDTVRVRVGNTAPMASAGGPYSSVRNTLITFSGGGSSDVENDPLTYAWDFGDGSTVPAWSRACLRGAGHLHRDIGRERWLRLFGPVDVDGDDRQPDPDRVCRWSLQRCA